MKTIQLDIEGMRLIEPLVHADARGYFFESYNAGKYDLPYAKPFVQDNEARSNKGVLRGLHFQQGDYAQGKLVRVIYGSVFDVAVDLRPESSTFGKWYAVVLSGENKKQLWVPRGFAHGYLVLEDNTVFSYKCDNYYRQESEQGIRYDDPEIGIEWPSTGGPYNVSEKDRNLGMLSSISL